MKRLKAVWGVIRQVLSVRGLLDWIGVYKPLMAAIISGVVVAWAKVSAVTLPILFVIGLSVFAAVLLIFRAVAVTSPSNAKKGIAIEITEALFDEESSSTLTSRRPDGREVSTKLVYITLVVEFRNMMAENCTVDRTSLMIDTLHGVILPRHLRELGPEPGGRTRELRTPEGVRPMEPNLRLAPGLTETRFVRFGLNRRVGVDDDFESKGTFKFAAIDSFGTESIAVRKPGRWPSDPWEQIQKRYEMPD